MAIAKKHEIIRKKKTPAETSGIPEGQEGRVITKDGLNFVVPEKEYKELESRGKLEKSSSQEQLKEQIKTDPSQFGFLKPGEETTKPESIDVITEEAKKEKEGFFQKEIPTSPLGALGIDVTPIPESLGGYPDTQTPIEMASSLAGGLTGALGAISKVGAIGWRVGGKIFGNGKKAAQAGTALKNTAKVKPFATKLRDYAIGGFAALKTGEGIIGYFSGRKIDEQQQAVNTIGQMATTIGGDSTEAAGDWRKGLQELDYLESQILYLESAIKAGTIASAAVKYNGKIYDINADMADQLATIDEQKTIIRSFVLTNSFPELGELEIQGILRELEKEGFVKPVDLTTSRRETE